MERIHFDKTKHDKQRREAFSGNFTADGNSVKGYAAVWDVPSCDRGGFYVLFPQGSMVLPDYDVRLLYNHDDNLIMGRESNDSLIVASDSIGVTIDGRLDDTYLDDFVLKRINRKDINGMSVGLYVLKSHTDERVISVEDVKGNPSLTDMLGETVTVEIYDQWLMDECSICPNPAFPQTNIESYSRTQEPKQEEKRNKIVSQLANYAREVELLSLTLE